MSARRRAQTAPNLSPTAGSRAQNRAQQPVVPRPVVPRKPSAFGSGRIWWHFAIDAGVLIVLLGLGVLGFGPTFGADPAYLMAGFGGILIGLLVAAAGAHWRLGLVTMGALGLIAYMFFGSAFAAPTESLAGFIPTGESLRGLLLGIMLSWKQLLTLAPPVGTSVDVLVVPYLSALLCAAVAGTLAWRVRRAYWTLVPVLVLFVVGIVFGTTQLSMPVLRGCLLAVIAIAWLSYRRELDRREGAGAISANAPVQDKAGARTALIRRMGMAVGVVAIASLITVLAAPILTVSDDRQVLRDAVIPPPDLHNLPSPLTKFRDYVKNQKDSDLFTVEGLPKDGRLRVAAMDSYDGVVFNVDPNSSASFSPIGDPKSIGGVKSESGFKVSVNVDAYQSVWVPSMSVPQSLAFTSASGHAPTLYLNKGSGTALDLDGVGKGDSYTMDVVAPSYDEKKLASADFGSVNLPKLENVPQVVTTKANDIVGEADTPLKKVRALEGALQSQGKFSNGLEGQVASTSGHSAARITKLLSGKEMVGDDEQYAVAMTLMARQLGIPARVVMGFYLDSKDSANGSSPVTIKGDDVHAWVEVNFAGVGWVPFNPTPDKDHVPNPPEPQNASKPKPQVLQPPPPPQEPADLPPDSAPDALNTDPKKDNPAAKLGAALLIVGVAAIPVIILLLPLLVIALMKSRRRKKRLTEGLPTDRVSGGWNEVLSMATDLGTGVSVTATRRETAVELYSAFPKSQSHTAVLAESADAAIFGPGQPSEAQVAQYWEHVEASVNDMRGSVGFFKRLRAKFSPRSLMADARARANRKAEAKSTALAQAQANAQPAAVANGRAWFGRPRKGTK